jgi:hypothetical protein
MTDHPTTFRAEPSGPERIDWDDRASIQPAEDSGGVLDAMKAIHRGTLAEMVAMLADMPEEQRNRYVIEKAGDRQLSAAEALALAERSDFPG